MNRPHLRRRTVEPQRPRLHRKQITNPPDPHPDLADDDFPEQRYSLSRYGYGSAPDDEQEQREIEALHVEP